MVFRKNILLYSNALRVRGKGEEENEDDDDDNVSSIIMK
jgi:hypothetical protein